MFVVHLMFLALLASGGQPGVPQYIQDKWMIPENPQYDDTDEQFPAVEETTVAESSSEGPRIGPSKDQILSSTPESFVVRGQDFREAADSSVWKIVLVVAILLVSIAGSVSMAYYLCVWRGGRIYYQAHKVYA